MTAAREQIFAAIDARLTAVDGVEYYQREPTGDPDIFPALALYDGGQGPVDGEVGNDQIALTVTVQGYAEGGAGAAAHAALNELHADVVSALMTLPAIDGLVETVEVKGLRISVALLASARRLAFAQDFEIQFATPWGDPSQFA
jgi:hypothetical protein